ncbi:penicillin-binding protein activator [Alphaproteobacteria bacterium]|nr:penicillin-binding protein activator [Alphaproteobacteria bacterium]
MAEISIKAEQKNAKIWLDVLDMQNMFENDRANQSGQSLIKGCHFCRWQTKGLIAAVTVIALAGCQPATTSSSSIPAVSKTALSSQMQQSLSVPKFPASSGSSSQTRSVINRTAPDISSADKSLDVKKLDQDGTTDLAAANAIMDSIIWQFQTDDKVIETTEPMIPIGADPSLSDDALDAAFALLSSRIRPQSFEPVFEVTPKGDGVIRVGLLVPLSGEYAALGMEIRRSVEMALFKINNPKIEILFLDTKGGETAGNAAMTGLNSDVDIFIGPLFTDAVTQARAVTDQLRDGRARPPMLLLSNNVDVASADRWLMGYLPEQQLDGLLGHAVSVGKRRFALIAQDSLFGQRLLTHASQRLADFGLTPEAVRVLSDDELADETNLKNAIRTFTHYTAPIDDAPLADSPFDAVIFAGDPAFALRTAPVLAFYDVGPDRALYLGNALWSQHQLLVEPSLQGGLFSTRPSNLDARFDADWTEIWAEPAGQLARVGFDAMALVAALAKSRLVKTACEQSRVSRL